MAVSVSNITPTRNQAAYLEQTIRSVLTQVWPGLEYVIVDGASTDGTVEILRRYGDRLRWISEPDRGQADAINKGIRITRGEIVAYLNSDDFYELDAVRRVVEVFESDPGVDLVYGDCYYQDDRQGIRKVERSKPATAEDLLRVGNVIGQPAAFFRRQALERAGLFDERYTFALDFDMWVRLLRGGRARHLPVPLATFRVHAESKTVTQQARATEELLDILARHGGRRWSPLYMRSQLSRLLTLERIHGLSRTHPQLYRLGKRLLFAMTGVPQRLA